MIERGGKGVRCQVCDTEAEFVWGWAGHLPHCRPGSPPSPTLASEGCGCALPTPCGCGALPAKAGQGPTTLLHAVGLPPCTLALVE